MSPINTRCDARMRISRRTEEDREEEEEKRKREREQEEIKPGLAKAAM